MVHIIKIYYENSKKEQEIRRLAVTSDVVSNFQHLLEKIQSVCQLPVAEKLQIKWKDSENDYILMSSNDELAQALANADDGLLRLYVSRKNEKTETTNIPKSNASNDVHPFVVCDGCDSRIFGIRYKCLQCRNYDLCSSCDAANKHPLHDMIKFVKPTHIPREWVFMGARKLWKSMFCRSPIDYFAYMKDQVSNSENSPGPLDGASHVNDNTIPKSASGSSTESADSSPSQPKEKNSPKGGAQQNPLPDFANLPRVFMDCLQNDFVGAPKLIHEGLNQVLKAVSGTIEVVDHNLRKAEFKKRQESGNETEPSVAKASTQTATTETSPSTSNQASEVNFTHAATTNENVDSDSMHADDKASTNEASDNEDEIIIDIDNGKSSNAPEAAAACADGWTLLEGGDSNQMECNEASDTRATDKVVAYPDLMDVEAKQQINKNVIESSDPVIISAVTTMMSMGFTNKGGWLERLIISKNGSINEALDALYPSIRQ